MDVVVLVRGIPGELFRSRRRVEWYEGRECVRTVCVTISVFFLCVTGGVVLFWFCVI